MENSHEKLLCMDFENFAPKQIYLLIPFSKIVLKNPHICPHIHPKQLLFLNQNAVFIKIQTMDSWSVPFPSMRNSSLNKVCKHPQKNSQKFVSTEKKVTILKTQKHL